MFPYGLRSLLYDRVGSVVSITETPTTLGLHRHDVWATLCDIRVSHDDRRVTLHFSRAAFRAAAEGQVWERVDAFTVECTSPTMYNDRMTFVDRERRFTLELEMARHVRRPGGVDPALLLTYGTQPLRGVYAA